MARRARGGNFDVADKSKVTRWPELDLYAAMWLQVIEDIEYIALRQRQEKFVGRKMSRDVNMSQADIESAMDWMNSKTGRKAMEQVQKSVTRKYIVWLLWGQPKSVSKNILGILKQGDEELAVQMAERISRQK